MKKATPGSKDSETKKQFLDLAAQADSAEGIRQGLEDVRNGRVRPAKEFFAEFEAEHGMSLSRKATAACHSA